jgi:hypothetical protein
LVENTNAKRLNSLWGPLYSFEGKDKIKKTLRPEEKERCSSALRDSKVPDRLELKVGARVMLIKNADHLVNGSMGVVVDFALYSQHGQALGLAGGKEPPEQDTCWYPLVKFVGDPVSQLVVPLAFVVKEDREGRAMATRVQVSGRPAPSGVHALT